jgi:hypothetical protein
MSDIANYLSINQYLLVITILWVLPWKGLALWKSARQEKKWWFIALLIINTLGILEILYIFVFSKLRKNKNNGSCIDINRFLCYVINGIA